jgi:hypothetical protein
MEGRAEELAAVDLLQQLRATAKGCERAPTPVVEGLPAGFGQIDDVIVLLQPGLLAAEDDREALEAIVRRLAEKNFLRGTQVIGKGGVWAALVSGCRSYGRGFHAELSESEGPNAAEALLGERAGRALVSARPKAHLPLANFVERGRRFTAEAIGRVTAGDVRVRWMGQIVLEQRSLVLTDTK